MHKSTFPQTGNHSWSCRTSILEGATFHKMSCRCFSLILRHERVQRRIRLCHFFTLFDIVAETTIVSSRTLPVELPLPAISKNSLYTLFCSLILDHGVSFIISISGAKILISYFLLNTSLHNSFQSVIIIS